MKKRTDETAPPRGRPRDPAVDAAVLSAALKLMAERGYERMSLDAVAEVAGVTKPTIYRRWASKADLATAALAEMQSKEPPAGTGHTWQDLTSVLRNFQTSLFRPNGMAMIGTLLVQERETPDLIAAFRERILVPRRRMVRSILESGVGRGEIAAEADLDAAVNLLIGSLYAKYLTGEPVPRDWPERIVWIVRSGVCGGRVEGTPASARRERPAAKRPPRRG